jgi:hypothetical protein
VPGLNNLPTVALESSPSTGPEVKGGDHPRRSMAVPEAPSRHLRLANRFATADGCEVSSDGLNKPEIRPADIRCRDRMSRAEVGDITLNRSCFRLPSAACHPSRCASLSELSTRTPSRADGGQCLRDRTLFTSIRRILPEGDRTLCKNAPNSGHAPPASFLVISIGYEAYPPNSVH